MSFHELVEGVRDKLRQWSGDGGDKVEVSTQSPRLENLSPARLATPPVDVYESDKELLIHVDVPGGSAEGALLAWAEAAGLELFVRNQPPPSGASWASEYPSHDFYRSFALPSHVDGAKATSSLKDGVLTIRIPKRAATARFIPVKPS